MSQKVIFDKKNVLVVGGAGFIGSHLCDDLVKNSKVICVDNFSTGYEKNIDHLLANENFEFIKHNINEPVELEMYPELQKFKIEFQGVQEIYNLACPMSPNNFEKNIIQTILTNSQGVKNVLDLAVKYKAKLLHVSSSVVYGHRENNSGKISEDNMGVVNCLSERAAYDEGKRFAETMIENYKKIYEIDAKIIRLFRTYGPRMPLGDGQMIPDFISDALDGKNLTVYGDERFISSFCYVGDCVDAMSKIMESDIDGPLNIGSDVDVNITDLAQKVIDFIKPDLKIEYAESKLFMKPLCSPDITKARNDLGWMPVVTLEKGIEKTIYDLRANKGLKGVEHALNI